MPDTSLDLRTAALVARDGTIDWLCLPRFDSAACFAALLGTADHGSWRIAPQQASPKVQRAYRGDTLVLETTFTTPEGEVAWIDVMPFGQPGSHVMRRLEGRGGEVAMGPHFKLRSASARTVPGSRASRKGMTSSPSPALIW